MRRVRMTGRVYTGQGWANSLTIQDGVIVALDNVGGDGSRVDEEIELTSGMLCPGIYGSHEHWLHCYFNAAGSAMSLAGCVTKQQVVGAMETQRDAQQLGTLMFLNWNTGLVRQAELTMDALNAITPDRPIIVYDQSFHSAQVNGAMMRLLEAQGLPEHAVGSKAGGYLTEEYVMFALGALTFDPDHLSAMLEEQQRFLLGLGFTRVFDKGIMGQELFWRLRDLFGSGRLVIPTEALVPVWMLNDEAIVTSAALPNFRLRGGKDFADGAFGARTAACGPNHYCGTENSGLLMRTPDQLMAGIEAVRKAGLDFFGVHCIGPAAIAQYARVVNEAMTRLGVDSDITVSFEHLECPGLEVVRRIAELQRRGCRVQVNTNPTFASDLVDYPGQVHPNVLARVNPYGDFRRLGLVAHAGTDGIPSHDVWGSIATMVARPDGQHDQELTIQEAFGLYSDGELAVGAPATFLHVDRDFIADPAEVGNVQVRETWIGGRRVWRRGV